MSCSIVCLLNLAHLARRILCVVRISFFLCDMVRLFWPAFIDQPSFTFDFHLDFPFLAIEFIWKQPRWHLPHSASVAFKEHTLGSVTGFTLSTIIKQPWIHHWIMFIWVCCINLYWNKIGFNVGTLITVDGPFWFRVT
jgi:hypothetical protein